MGTVWYGLIASILCSRYVGSPHRRSVQSRLARLFDSQASARAAASIAGLVGECSAAAAMHQAGHRFRSVRLSDISFEDLADNTPNPALFELTEPTKLQSCDAFISHSWHDDPHAKWDALQTWRAQFILKHGREPSVWFDKCCIDQRNIDADLRCLPIFLSGCQALVVLCGDTYLTRLWCIVEIFAFVHMRRDIEDIQFTFLQQHQDLEVCSKVSHAPADVDSFDANRCVCSNEADKERMLNIIRAAYGDLDGFNVAMLGILKCAATGVGFSEQSDMSSALGSDSDPHNPSADEPNRDDSDDDLDNA
uniref:TIR domain-containing protein n=1 Tax=Zooxanthella nutricula TaxID=1333877 RepID=A0A7S2NLC2_9DINO